jgi:hypothetical protein
VGDSETVIDDVEALLAGAIAMLERGGVDQTLELLKRMADALQKRREGSGWEVENERPALDG